MNKTKTSGILVIIIGMLRILHHICVWQPAFNTEDMLHHEFFEAIFFTGDITLLISNCCNKKRSD
jgi:hypothetical protein